MITVNYKIHSGNAGSYSSNFDFKIFFFFFLNVKKYGEECVEWGVEKEASSWWIQLVWKYFSNVEEKLQEQGYMIN